MPSDRSLLPWIPGLTVDAFAVGMGVWWLYSVSLVYAGRSFDELMLGLPLALLVALGAIGTLTRRWSSDRPAPVGALPSWLPWLLVPAVFGLIGWHVAALPFVVAWLPLALAVVGANLAIGPQVSLGSPTADRRDLLSIGLAVLVAAVVVTGTHRFEVDDAYHINAMISTLEHPDLPVLSFDGLHGDERAPIQQLIHRPQTYEILVAALARLTGADPRSIYWIHLPIGLAGLVVLSTWRLARLLDRRSAWLAIWVVFLIWNAWGDDYRTYGSYTYPRLFQGKPFFILFFVPALLTGGARFTATPSWRAFVVLLLTQCAAVTWTSSALVLSPVVAGIGLLSQVRPNRRSLLTAAVGLLASVPLAVSLILTKLELRAVGGLRHDGWIRDASAVLGTTDRAPLALLTLALLPLLGLLARREGSAWLARVSGLFVLLVFNGFTAPFLAENVAELFSWRLYWTVPLPLWVAITLALGMSFDGRGSLAHRAGRIALALFGLALFIGAGRQVHRNHRVSWSWWSHKTPFHHQVLAERVDELTDRGDLVAAAPRVAERVVGLDDRPFLTSVRQSYLTNLSRHWSPEETAGRQLLLDYLDSPEVLPSTLGALDLLDAWCVKVVVPHRRTAYVPATRSELVNRGYVPSGRRASHQIYTHPRTDCQPVGPASIQDLRRLPPTAP